MGRLGWGGWDFARMGKVGLRVTLGVRRPGARWAEEGGFAVEPPVGAI